MEPIVKGNKFNNKIAPKFYLYSPILKYSNNIKTNPVVAIPVIPKKAPVIKPKNNSTIY